MLNEKISIITVCYNAESSIKETIESVLGQTYKNIEYVIVDGASKDQTVSIIKSYMAHYQKQGIELQFVSEKDSGIQDAYNKAIRLATGSWLVFINSGDKLYNSEVLTKVMTAIPDRKVDVIYGDILFFLHKKNKTVRISYVDKLDLGFLKKSTICHQAMLFRTKLFFDFGNYDCNFKIASDFDRILVFFLAGASYYHIPEIISVFVDDGISSTNYVQLLMERLKILNKRLEKVDLAIYMEHYYKIGITFLKKTVFKLH